MKGYTGDFRGKDPKVLLEELREKLHDSRSKYLHPLPIPDTVRQDLERLVTGFEEAPEKKRPDAQQALDLMWKCLRGEIDAGGLMVNYTPVRDPYNVVNLAWSGGVSLNCMSKPDLTMDFSDPFLQGCLTFQGPEFDPMPALDLEQKQGSSYFQSQVMDDDQINKSKEYQQRMRPYRIEDWMATPVTCTRTHVVIMIPFFYHRPDDRQKRKITDFMSQVAPVFARLFQWMGLTGEESICTLLDKQPRGTGTILMDWARASGARDAPWAQRSSCAVTYDHKAIELIREQLPDAQSVDHMVWRLQREVSFGYNLADGERDIHDLPLFSGDFDAKVHVSWVKGRKFVRYVFGTIWEVDEGTRQRFRAHWKHDLQLPKNYSGELGATINPDTKRFREHLRDWVLDRGKVVAIVTGGTPIVVIEPVTRQTLAAVLAAPRKLKPVSAWDFVKLLSECRKDLRDKRQRLMIHDKQGVFAIAQNPEGHRLHNQLLRHVPIYEK